MRFSHQIDILAIRIIIVSHSHRDDLSMRFKDLRMELIANSVVHVHKLHWV